MITNKKNCMALASIPFIIFIVLAALVLLQSNLLQIIDQPIIELVRGTITPPKTVFFKTITALSNPGTIIVLTLAAFSALYYFKEQLSAWWLIINVVLIQGAGNVVLKHLFLRPRPPKNLHLVPTTSYSFPSGHAMGSMIFYGTILLLVPFFIKQKPLKILVQSILVMLIFLIGISRIYLGVHYPTDIIAGWSIGLTWLIVSYPFFLKYYHAQLTKGI